jgi:hypothetical protein
VRVALLRFTHGLPVSLDSVPLKHVSQIRGPLQDAASTAQEEVNNSSGIRALRICGDQIRLLRCMGSIRVRSKLFHELLRHSGGIQ